MNTLTDEFNQSPGRFTQLTNKNTGQTHPIVKDTFWVGRSASCDVVINDPAVSERHIKFVFSKNRWFLYDLTTKNGTFLNNVKVKNALVPVTNLITIGKTPLELNKDSTPSSPPSSIVGHNPQLLEAIKNAKLASNTSLPIMILGETGTGKELFAKMIHDESKRHKQPFVAVNCGSVPPQLFASELFGHKAGAYTDAKEERIGHIERAGTGTLFLDEIGELPLDAQPAILRLTEDKQYRRIGSDQSSKAKCRLITATNNQKILRPDVFRKDLFFRLGAICIELPPLRQRKEDIPTLLNYFLESNKKEYGSPNITPSLLKKFINHSWPGNIRELKHAACRLAIFGPKSIKFDQTKALKLKTTRQHKGESTSVDKAFQKSLIHAMSLNGTVRKAADYLGLPKSTLSDRLKEFNITNADLEKH